jgi:RNA polymerase sigma factor (sigma-70 family)
VVHRDDGIGQGLATPPVRSLVVDGEEFDAFFLAAYPSLLRCAMAVGATQVQAEEAASQAMLDILRRWSDVVEPMAYARRAVISHFIRAKVNDRRRLDRIVAAGHVAPAVSEDTDLNVWEEEQWVAQLLATLPAVQRAVMTHLYNGLEHSEIAELLGKTPEAVRKNLQLARAHLREELERLGRRSPIKRTGRRDG